jgi:hypothetical protein
LIINNNWRGLVIDGDQDNIRYVRSDNLFWKHDLTATCHFITKENINNIISDSGFNGELGLLSIDIDGNDYWIWNAITVVNPEIVICEYNSLFGIEHAVTIPYDPKFQRLKTHYSGLYAGCSLKALFELAKEKGYAFIGCNNSGNNAYFIRQDKVGPLKVPSLEEGYVQSKFRESRDQFGNFSYLDKKQSLKLIADLPIFDIERNELMPLGKVIC